jgi:valyl-tRNA synthetase
MVKPAYGQPIDEKTFAQTIEFFEDLLKLMHPFMPFLTEEIWHTLRTRDAGSTIMFESWPMLQPSENGILKEFDYFEQLITGIRTLRKEKNIAQKEAIDMHILPAINHSSHFLPLVEKLGNIKAIHIVQTEMSGAVSFGAGATVVYVDLGGFINKEDEIARLEKDLDYQQGFLQSVLKKLSNERFVQNAPPAVLECEQKKQADAEAKIASITEQLRGLRP